MTMDTGILAHRDHFSLPGSEEIKPWVILHGAFKMTEGGFMEKLKHLSEFF